MTHQLINPDGLIPPVGFSHVVVAEGGKTVWLGGQTGHRADESIDADLVAQFAQACRNVAVALKAAGAEPEHLVSMVIYTTDPAAYRANLKALGEEYRRVFGRHFPAMALFGVTELFDPRSLVELVCVAVVP